MPPESIDITIERILHSKPNQFRDSGVAYLIAKASTAQGKRLTVKGSMNDPVCWESYRLFGQHTTDEKYVEDEIFKFTGFHVISPTTKKGAFKYFTNHVKGVSGVYASTIINELGDNAIVRLVESPAIIHDIKDLPKNVYKSIYDHFIASNANNAIVIAELTELFDGYSVSKNVIESLVENFGSSALSIIQKNPYILIKYPRMGWDKVDAIARKVFSIANESKVRILAAIRECMSRYSDLGHTYCDHITLKMELFNLVQLRIQEEWIEAAFAENVIRGDVINGNKIYQLTDYFEAEKEIAFNIRRISDDAFPIDVELSGEGLDGDQLDAFRLMEQYGVAILAGIPGSGKTFTVARFASELSHIYPEKIFMFGAPTGRAAKRLKELLDHHNPANTFECSTIHKILKWKFSTKEASVPERSAKANRGRPRFESAWEDDSEDEDKNNLPIGIYIIEESSMGDIFMMSSLTSQIPSGSRLIIVGDPYQLPSIRAGAFLRDLLATQVPSVKLETPRRNAGRIVRACWEIKNGTTPKPSPKFDLESEPKENWIHIEQDDPKKIHRIILELHKKASMDKFWDMQVISPQKKVDHIGCDDLNKALSLLLNPRQIDIMGGEKSSLPFTIGDKVIRTKNAVVNGLMAADVDTGDEWDWESKDEYDLMFQEISYNVYPERVVNGDLGVVLGCAYLDRKPHVVVELKNPTRICIFPTSEPEITLAYSVTVHKFQGSSTKCVIVPLHGSFYWNQKTNTGLFSRELVYTMFSRAEDKLITVGQSSSLRDAVSRKTINQRNTRLRDFVMSEMK